jgi:RNA polymerase sigma-70 factor (ECF subfamily)
MDEYAGLLSRVASTYEANESLQQELFQEICVAVWQAMKSFKAEASVKTYILRVAHNRCVSHVSKQVKSPKTLSWHEDDENSKVEELASTSVQSLEHEVAQSQQIQHLLSLVRALKIPARQVMALSLEGLSYKEIAEVTGISANNVGVMINRIKNDLQGQMQHDS